MVLKNNNATDDILKVLLQIADNFETLSREIRTTIQPIIEEKFKKAENQGTSPKKTSFVFSKPLQGGRGFERLLLKTLEGEASEHPDSKYNVTRNSAGEIVEVKVQGPKEHVEHVLSVCRWIEKKLGGAGK